MKQQLLDLYQAHHADYFLVRQQFPKAAMDGPFLVSPDELYTKQATPLLIVGQETKEWSSCMHDLDQPIQCYVSTFPLKTYPITPW